MKTKLTVSVLLAGVFFAGSMLASNRDDVNYRHQRQARRQRQEDLRREQAAEDALVAAAGGSFTKACQVDGSDSPSLREEEENRRVAVFGNRSGTELLSLGSHRQGRGDGGASTRRRPNRHQRRNVVDDPNCARFLEDDNDDQPRSFNWNTGAAVPGDSRQQFVSRRRRN